MADPDLSGLRTAVQQLRAMRGPGADLVVMVHPDDVAAFDAGMRATLDELDVRVEENPNGERGKMLLMAEDAEETTE